MTNNIDKAFIRRKLLSDNRWLMRGIVAIFNLQTAEEQVYGQTVENNGIGFNGVDAEILSSFAVQIKERGSLSPRQLEIARKKMPKYAGQLAKIATGKV